MNRTPPPTVLINGTPKQMLPRLYFDQLVRSAFGGVFVDEGAYVITYDGPKAGRGTLKPRESIATEDGMTFEVTQRAA